MSYLPAIELETGASPDAAVIWLHGLGADGNDFAPIVPELHLPAELAVRFVFPHAPSIPVTINGGIIMPAWFDIRELAIDRKIDVDGLLASAKRIEALVDRERQRGIASRRIVLAGFSQGGAIAYQVALSHPEPLGGLLAMSTYFATAEVIRYSAANQAIALQIQHGDFDPVVPEHLGRKAKTRLIEQGYTVVYQSYPMEHAVCAEQIGDISRWLQSLLCPTPTA